MRRLTSRTETKNTTVCALTEDYQPMLSESDKDAVVRTSKLAKKRVSSWPELYISSVTRRKKSVKTPGQRLCKTENHIHPANNDQKRNDERRQLLQSSGQPISIEISFKRTTHDGTAHTNTDGKFHLVLHGHPDGSDVLRRVSLQTDTTMFRKE